MRSIEAVKALHRWDVRGRRLFRSRELGLVFDESGNTLRKTIGRLLNDDVLERVSHDVYLYALGHASSSLVGELAVFLRPGELTFESLESAASQWGLISQVPIGRVTCVTTGRAGEVVTPYGVIDYEHTDETLNGLLDAAVNRMPQSPLPIATKPRALRDLLEYDRSCELIDWEEACDEG